MFVNQDSRVVPSASRTFNPSDYPRTYTAPIGDKIATVLLSLLIGSASIVCIWYFSTVHTSNDAFARYVLMVLCALLSITCLYAALAIFRFKFTLHPNRIDYQNGRAGWSIRRDQIDNWRIRMVKNTRKLELTSTGSGGGILQCTLRFKPDAAFNHWFADLPNADASELKASEDEIRENPAFGSTPEERMNAAARARKVAQVAYGVTFAITFWTIFYPHPYNIPIWLCLATPWAAIFACWQSKGLYTLGAPNKNAKADLTMPLIMPAFALMSFAMQNMNLVQWTEPIVPGVVVGLVLAILIGASNQHSEKTLQSSALSLLFCSVYAIFTIIATNKMLDNSAPESYPAKILAQRQVHGKGVTSYLTVTAWGPRTASSELTVSSPFYDRYHVGDTICIHVHAGAYHMPWYTIEDCDDHENSLPGS